MIMMRPTMKRALLPPPRGTTPPIFLVPLFFHSLLLLSLLHLPRLPPTHATESYYCGTNWMGANTACADACPSMSDVDCISPQTCFGYTSCADKLKATPPPTPRPTPRPTPPPTTAPTPRPPPTEPPSAAPAASAPPTPPRRTPPPTSAAPSSAAPTVLGAAPSAAPVVRPLLVAAPTVDGGGTVLSAASQRCYGVIFEVRTTPAAPAVSLATLEFYSPLRGANVAYEVWAKAGTWHGHMGQARDFARVAAGNVTTSARPLGLTRLPRWEGAGGALRLDGGGRGRLAVYLTLTTRSLLYAHSTNATETEAVDSIEAAERKPTEDTVVLARTPELIVYEGAAIMTYPFQKASQRLFYRMPRGFVGRLWYHRAPCLAAPATNATDANATDANATDAGPAAGMEPVESWEECDATPPPPARMPNRVEELPAAFLAAAEAAPPPAAGAGAGSALTAAPTRSPAPTAVTAKVNLVLVFSSAGRDRLMDTEEQRAFEATALGFYQGREVLRANEVELDRATVWFQQALLVQEGGGDDAARGRGDRLGRRRTAEGEGEGSVRRRALQDAGIENVPNSQGTATAPSLEVTLIISILYSPLPQRITQELLRTLLSNNRGAFLQGLRKNVSPALSAYFSTVNALPSILAVDKVTASPTPRPSAAPTPLLTLAAVEDHSLPLWLRAAIVSGALYALLMAAGVCYVKGARARMSAERREQKAGLGGATDVDAVLDGMRRGDDTDGAGQEGRGARGKTGERTKLLRNTSLARVRSMKLQRQGSIFNKRGSSKDVDVEENGGFANGRPPQQERYSDNPLEEGSDDEAEDGNSGEEEEDEEEVSSMEDSYYSEEEDSDMSEEDSDMSEEDSDESEEDSHKIQ